MKALLAICTVIAVSGCAAQVDQPTMARAHAPIYCDSEQQCTKIWEATQTWLIRNSGYRLQTVTSSVIQTYGPQQNMPTLAFTVIKEPVGNGLHQIKIAASCSNMFGCQPNEFVAIADYKDFILQLP